MNQQSVIDAVYTLLRAGGGGDLSVIRGAMALQPEGGGPACDQEKLVVVIARGRVAELIEDAVKPIEQMGRQVGPIHKHVGISREPETGDVRDGDA